jgi:hypothetical protein
MPDYGLLGPDEGRGLLPWSWAEERLSKSHNYWISTVGHNGQPHSMGVWGVWLENGFWFSTAANSRKARNLAADVRCVVTTERADEAVIVEGWADRSAAAHPELLRRYVEKYGSGYPGDSLVFVIRPLVVFGFIEHEDQFTGSATRWRFESR